VEQPQQQQSCAGESPVALTGGVGRRAATNSSPAAAPGLRDTAGRPRAPPPGGGPAGRGPSLRKLLWKRTLRQLSSLPLAIGELAVVGTIIEQNKPLEFYAQARRPAPTWVRRAADELSLSGSWGVGTGVTHHVRTACGLALHLGGAPGPWMTHRL